jgi:hypothetical protein
MDNLPKLLRRILARNTLENLAAAGVLVDELGHVKHAIVDYDVEPGVGGVVAGHVGWGELFGHFGF